MPDFTRKLTILSCLLFTGFCFWKAGAGLVGGGDASVLPSAQAAVLPSVTPPRVVTTPIQDMRPGMRIVGRNPLRIQTESAIDPTPDGWRLLSVQMLKQDGSYFEAKLLRPLSWIRRHRAQPGATIQLNMPEMYVVGAAEVLAIADCPPIDPGEGPVVLSTFKNVSDNVLNIYVEGEATPIGVTAGHPIWSEDRQAFVHSEKLQIGERLRSAVGKTVRITSIEIRAGPEPVYNLEVAGEHVYSVTDSGLLVHNTGPCGFPDGGNLASIETKITSRTATRSEWKIYSQNLRKTGQPVPTGSLTSNFEKHVRFDTAYRFYLNEAKWSSRRIGSHLSGIDFSKSVSIVDLPSGSRMVQYYVPGRPIGNYFAEAGTPATQLGINPAGRIPVLLESPFGTRALRTTAAEIVDTWTVPGEAFHAQGGGIQFFVPNPNAFAVGY